MLIDQAAAGGAAVLVASSDTDELVRLSSRVLIMRGGEIVAELAGDEITSSNLERAQILSGTYAEERNPMTATADARVDTSVDGPDIDATATTAGWSSRLKLDKFSALYLWAIFLLYFGLTRTPTSPPPASRSRSVRRPSSASWRSRPRPARHRHLRSLDRRQPRTRPRHPVPHEPGRSPDLGGRDVGGARVCRGGVRQWLRRRPPQGQLVHRDPRHEPGRHRHDPGDLRQSPDPDQLPDGFVELGSRRWLFNLPMYFFYMLVIAAVLWVVLEHTPLGRYMFATGGGREAARLAGVKTDRLVWGSLVASATIAGFAGFVFAWKTNTFQNSAGPGFLFPAVAAVFFGASQLKGRANVWGTLIMAVFRAGVRHQGAPALVRRRHVLDRAVVQRPVPADRRVARQPAPDHQDPQVAEADITIDRIGRQHRLADASDVSQRSTPGMHRSAARRPVDRGSRHRAARAGRAWRMRRHRQARRARRSRTGVAHLG